MQKLFHTAPVAVLNRETDAMANNTLDQALTAFGIIIKGALTPGRITRHPTTAKPRSRNGWVIPFADGRGAVFGDWQSGEHAYWFEGGDTGGAYDREAIERALAVAEAERLATHSRAAATAQRRYEGFRALFGHPYLTRKGVEPEGRALGTLRIDGRGDLVVPVYSAEGAIQSLQTIDANGGKRFMAGGKMAGGRFAIGETEGAAVVWLAEGLATGLSLHRVTGQPVAVAFNAGNLATVAESLRASGAELRVMADNDAHGVGLRAAMATGCTVWMPPETGTDCNDWRDRMPSEWLTEWRQSALPSNETLPPTTIIKLTSGESIELSDLRGRPVNGQAATLPDGRVGRLLIGNRDRAKWSIELADGERLLLDSTPPSYTPTTPEPTRRLSKRAVVPAVAGIAARTAREGGVTLLRAPVGAGKSRAISAITPTLRLMVALPTIELAEQHAAALARPGEQPMIFRGRGQSVDGVPMCKRWAEWQALPVPEWRKSSLLCECPSERPELAYCEHHRRCPYIAQRGQLESATMVIGAHNYLTIGMDYRPDLVIADESIVGRMSADHHRYDEGNFFTDFDGPMGQVMGPIIDALRDGQQPSIDESAEAVMRQWLVECDARERLPGIWPGMWDGEVRAQIKMWNEQRKAGGVSRGAVGLVRSLLRREANGVWGSKAGVWYLDAAKEYKIRAVDTDRTDRLDNGQDYTKPAPLLILDATGRPELYQAIFGQSLRVESLAVTDAEPVTVVRYAAESWNKGQWFDAEAGTVKPGHAGYLAMLHQMTGFGVVANKTLVEAAVSVGLPDEVAGHFGALRGLNRFEELPGVIVVGRDEPTAPAVEAMARSLWRDEALGLSGRWQRQVTAAGHEVNGHADSRVAALLASIRDDELTQAAGRARHLWHRAKTIMILGTVPCPEFDSLAIAGDDAELPPLVLGRLAERYGCQVVPVSRALTAETIGLKETDSKGVYRELTDWIDRQIKGGVSLIDICNRVTPPLNYRVTGDRGQARSALSFGVTDQEAGAILAQIHGKAVSIRGTTPPAELAIKPAKVGSTLYLLWAFAQRMGRGAAGWVDGREAEFTETLGGIYGAGWHSAADGAIGLGWSG